MQEDCDSEEEELLGQQMFFEDLKDLRRLVYTSLMDCLSGHIALDKEISLKTTYFMQKMEQAQSNTVRLEANIRRLEQLLADE